MKKFDLWKTIQLIIFIGLTIFCAVQLMGNRQIAQMIASNADIRLLCASLWGVLGISFLFIFVDFSIFSTYKKDFKELDYAVHSDPVSGIANRYSCDALIEKYLDKPLPPEIACVMFDLSNIGEINKRFGHAKGNEVIREFSNILQKTAVDRCFIGRNGGNKFMALFESATEDALNQFMTLISKEVSEHNAEAGEFPIEYRYGLAFDEGENATTINDLISLSNRRIYENDTSSRPDSDSSENSEA